MSWMSQLYQTYEKMSTIGQEGEESIVPIAHIIAMAQLEVTIMADGSFISAKILEKGLGQTLIPVTEASESRSSDIAPHPLCDMLPYLAGDFGEHCKTEKLKKKAENKFAAYMKNQEMWVQSDYCHPKVKAIFTFLQKAELTRDLVESGILVLNEDGTFSDNKLSERPYEKVLVRFRVLGADDLNYDGTWEDNSLIASYTNYYLSKLDGRMDICYLTGRKQVISENHPKGIVQGNYNAKLISANDNRGFTFRGRFQNSSQAYALSYDASQKIHSALIWLVKHQGRTEGKKHKRTFVCWNPEGKETPDILDAFPLFQDDQPETGQTQSNYQRKISRVLQGYREHFEEDDPIIIMVLDAATPGRLSITYYNEFGARDFLDRVEYWGRTCNWMFLKVTPEKKAYRKMDTPIFSIIARCAFGREKNGFIDLDDKVLGNQTQRLAQCMLDQQPMPWDIVQALTERASTPMAYSGWNRELVLSTACAVITKYYIDKGRKGGEEEMKLDLENRDRSYLFGRLLAVLEKVERATYEPNEKKEPNAIHLQSAYVNHPMQTWEVLEDTLWSYFQKLGPGSREYYRRTISEIIRLIRDEDAASLNQKLKESYLLGYYLQRAELNKKNEEEQKDEHPAE